LNDHSIAISRAAVANRAINVISLAPPLEKFRRQGHWNRRDQPVTNQAAKETFVLVQMAARDGVRRNWPRAAAVLEEILFGERFHLSLVHHSLPAAASQYAKRKQGDEKFHDSTS
jgi:hypothetical protein